MEIDLGHTPNYLLDVPTAEPSEKEGKPKKKPIYYPSVSIEGGAGKKLAANVKAGEEVTFTVTARVSEVSIRDKGENARLYDGHSGTRVELELKSIEIEGDESGEEEESAEDAISKFRSSKSTS